MAGRQCPRDLHPLTYRFEAQGPAATRAFRADLQTCRGPVRMQPMLTRQVSIYHPG